MSTTLSHPTIHTSDKHTVNKITDTAIATAQSEDFPIDYAVATSVYAFLPTITNRSQEEQGPTLEGDTFYAEVLTRADGEKLVFWAEYGDPTGEYQHADLLPEDDDEAAEIVTGWTYNVCSPDGEPQSDGDGDTIKPGEVEALARIMATRIVEWADKATPLVQASASETGSGVEINLNGDTVEDALDDLLDYLNTAEEPEKPFTITRMTVDDQEVDNIDSFDPLADTELEVTIEGAYGDSDETVRFLAISEC
ncbi:hypothetical protein I6I10_07490 [Corynebacterium glucuronolyticum]|uniref:Uncharacterized protein n=1 Tax=Corynebacterium glucuronolyticum TaxID=39791 RepID=A0A7T4BN55_9CORY|nr:hypothetical protein [Corynebacterium glucuronolyticum]QQB45324.1 hypothetical protein I6I10_07190 [Corynebacterium glucuronolyticum]QQB45379.1 hypothetical protein I6I10_07490 [Corynebacterium glucuronolyticum]WKD64004.1 hypothetical protein CGLUCO_08795 [Corynebacterium glucuronolyticum DSM 44120]SMB83353.1 hypothetical protein SAMN05660745_02639 [Corynebacterium glucuronolyticum]